MCVTITGGYDAETDDELRRRYFEKVRSLVTFGNKYHYINWAKEVVVVGDANVAIERFCYSPTVKIKP